MSFNDAERIGVQAALQFAARYWKHGQDPEAQYHLGVLSHAVKSRDEEIEALQAEAGSAAQATTGEHADALRKLSELRELADFWYENRDWESGDADEGPRMMQWGAAAGHIHGILGDFDD